MITDKECARLADEQYNGHAQGLFDKVFNTAGIDYAVKFYQDCTDVSFEGSHTIPDWEKDFRFRMVRVIGIGGVEEGFNEGTMEVVQQLLGFLPQEKPIILQGHSLGAAEAHIVARRLIVAGIPPGLITRVLWGSPNAGNGELTAGLSGSPCRSYRNFRNSFDQDFVCVVPQPIYGMPFERQSADVFIDEEPELPDSWGPLYRHHFFLYKRAMK